VEEEEEEEEEIRRHSPGQCSCQPNTPGTRCEGRSRGRWHCTPTPRSRSHEAASSRVATEPTPACTPSTRRHTRCKHPSSESHWTVTCGDHSINVRVGVCRGGRESPYGRGVHALQPVEALHVEHIETLVLTERHRRREPWAVFTRTTRRSDQAIQSFAIYGSAAEVPQTCGVERCLGPRP
jgi:hypothetical protein